MDHNEPFRPLRHRLQLIRLRAPSRAIPRQRHLGGLDTRINNANAKFLINAAKATEKDSNKWYQAIAPHCHYYRAAVDHVILQYPPGTGFVLSWFPESRSLALLYVAGMTLIAGVFVAAALMARLDAFQLLAAAMALGVIDWIMKQPDTVVGSASVPVTLVFVPLCALMTLLAFPGPGKARPLLAFALGLIGGILFATRLPNILLLVGAAVAILVNASQGKAGLRQIVPAIIAGLAGFAITGVFPVLTADWINAGSPFSTTYSGADASPPLLHLGVIKTRLVFYFTHPMIAPVSIAAAFAFVVRLLTTREYPPANGRYGLSVGALVCFGLSLAFFVTHNLMQPYYMLPASVLVLCLVTFELLISAPLVKPLQRGLKIGGLTLAPLLILAALRIHDVTPVRHVAVLPKEVTAPASIVWADVSGSTAYYYDHKYTAKLPFANDCLRDKLVHQVFARGRDQYFIEDTPTMKVIIARLSKIAPLQPAGVFRTYDTMPIFKLSADAMWTGKPCSEL